MRLPTSPSLCRGEVMRSELFEETIKQHRDSLAEELLQLGKYREAQLVEWDIERNESDYEYYFNAGWSAQQSKIDELQKRVDDLTELNRLKTIALQQSVNRTSPYVHEKIVALEQALKGGSDEIQNR